MRRIPIFKKGNNFKYLAYWNIFDFHRISEIVTSDRQSNRSIFLMSCAVVSRFKRLSTSPSDGVNVWKSRCSFWSQQIAKEALACLNYWVHTCDVFPRPASAWINNAPSGQEYVKGSVQGFLWSRGNLRCWLQMSASEIYSLLMLIWGGGDEMMIIGITTSWREALIGGRCISSWAGDGVQGALRLSHHWMYGKGFKWEDCLCCYGCTEAFNLYRLVEFNWKLHFPPNNSANCFVIFIFLGQLIKDIVCLLM